MHTGALMLIEFLLGTFLNLYHARLGLEPRWRGSNKLNIHNVIIMWDNSYVRPSVGQPLSVQADDNIIT